MVQLINLFIENGYFFVWVAFMVGLTGGLHCVGMCGGLVTASCERPQAVFQYQLGRLMGYLFLGLFTGNLSRLLQLRATHPYLSAIPGVIIGLMFIYWGVQNFIGKQTKFIPSKFLSRVYLGLSPMLKLHQKNLFKPLLIGFISIFLPCGLLYGVVLGTLSLNSVLSSSLVLFAFWLGTLPGMLLAPTAFQKLIRPLQLKLPRTMSVGLISLGLLTITYRVIKIQDRSSELSPAKSRVEKSCH